MLLKSPLYRCENRSPEKLVLLPQVTQLGRNDESPPLCCVLHRPGLWTCLVDTAQRGPVSSLRSRSSGVARVGGRFDWTQVREAVGGVLSGVTPVLSEVARGLQVTLPGQETGREAGFQKLSSVWGVHEFPHV